ncbi:MAG: Gfo/Idh/MocA family oxidoreductase [Acidimicrobiales bacterium]
MSARESDVAVGLVGVGTIAATHLLVLSELPEVSLQFVVDPDPATSVSFRTARPPHYHALGDAFGDHQPDLVVITAPTPTHAELTYEALAGSTARVLVEKPLVDDPDALSLLRSRVGGLDPRTRVSVAHHFAFSPEVRWSADQLARHPGWGPVTRITSCFHDPYIADAERSFAAYTSSWIDSGVNQLSMLARFVDLVERGPLHECDGGASAWCSVVFAAGSDALAGSALLRTSWQAIASSKRTTVELGHSGVEVWLDHTAVTAFVAQDGRVVDALVNDGLTPRKIAHYRPLYQSLLSDTPDPILSFDTACTVVDLLHGRASA